jgi:hypothetical protein
MGNMHGKSVAGSLGEKRFVLALIEDLTLYKQLLEANKRHGEELEKTVQERTAETGWDVSRQIAKLCLDKGDPKRHSRC